MNQLLISQRVYLTPELKRERFMLKIYLILSVFAICVLISYYVYGAYQGFQDELLAQDILTSMVPVDNTTVSKEEAIVVFLDADETQSPSDDTQSPPIDLTADNFPEEPEQATIPSTYTAKNGKTYNMVGILQIPKINLDYPILSKTNDETLKISVAKFWGPDPNEVGNFCIAGHNMSNTRAFSNIYKLKNGDIIKVTDLTGRTIEYKVYSHYIVDVSNVQPTSQLTNGRKEVTLITCTNGTKERRIVKAVEVENV